MHKSIDQCLLGSIAQQDTSRIAKHCCNAQLGLHAADPCRQLQRLSSAASLRQLHLQRSVSSWALQQLTNRHALWLHPSF